MPFIKNCYLTNLFFYKFNGDIEKIMPKKRQQRSLIAAVSFKLMFINLIIYIQPFYF